MLSCRMRPGVGLNRTYSFRKHRSCGGADASPVADCAESQYDRSPAVSAPWRETYLRLVGGHRAGCRGTQRAGGDSGVCLHGLWTVSGVFKQLY